MYARYSAPAFRRALCAGALLSALALVASRAPSVLAIDFIRGDANDDLSVGVSDAYYILRYLFQGGPSPNCAETMDVDDSNGVNITDATYLLNWAVGGGNPPPAPFPGPGGDPAAPEGDGATTGLGCDGYGEGQPLEDAAARLEILDAVADGGDSPTATITVGMSSSADVGGLYGVIRSSDSVFVPSAAGDSTDLSGTMSGGYLHVRTDDEGDARFGYVPTLTRDLSIPGSASVVAVLELEVCLAAGTTAGEYALTIEDAELSDAATGRAIHAQGVGGTLTVLADFTGESCELSGPPPGGGGGPIDPPENPEGQFRLESAQATPGGSVSVPMFMSANADIQGYSFSVDYNEDLLAGTGIDQVYLPENDGSGFRASGFNGDNDTPGEAGFDEGYFWAAMVFSFVTQEYNLPTGQEHHIVSLEFDVRETAPSGSEADVTFEDGAPSTGQPVQNNLTVLGASAALVKIDSVVLLDASVKIIDEITVFIRGDTNGDESVDVSDPQATLGYLFRGGRRPHCFDAADANDDGLVNISDALATLNALFLDGPSLPPPAELGPDPTEDRLTCLELGT